MAFWRALKRRVKAAVPPLLFAGMAAYFAWHAIHGERGTEARQARLEDIRAAERQLEEAQRLRAAERRRVEALRSEGLDRDQLEERVRALLNLTAPNEIVIPYEAGRRLF
ncbi:MAG: septum formation initiator family protein [Rhodovarius sp.]|nr:septum formation initiator family protein [Rhodovarius sp.]MCX7933268.1 septum formation initiator family protein [Rhodovarius sp.]MDW8316032.1 septum formation initiator family protein [Rhodovarius sp.]